MTDLKPLAALKRASKLLGDYNVAKQGHAQHVAHVRETYVPSGMCRHTWARHVKADEIRACESAAWDERLAILRAKIIEMGYDPDA